MSWDEVARPVAAPRRLSAHRAPRGLRHRALGCRHRARGRRVEARSSRPSPARRRPRSCGCTARRTARAPRHDAAVKVGGLPLPVRQHDDPPRQLTEGLPVTREASGVCDDAHASLRIAPGGLDRSRTRTLSTTRRRAGCLTRIPSADGGCGAPRPQRAASRRAVATRAVSGQWRPPRRPRRSGSPAPGVRRQRMNGSRSGSTGDRRAGAVTRHRACHRVRQRSAATPVAALRRSPLEARHPATSTSSPARRRRERETSRWSGPSVDCRICGVAVPTPGGEVQAGAPRARRHLGRLERVGLEVGVEPEHPQPVGRSQATSSRLPRAP